MQRKIMDVINDFQRLSRDLSRKTNINELFNDYSILCVQLQSSRGVNARHFEMITDRMQVRNNQMNGMMIGAEAAAYRNRIADLGILEERNKRGDLLDIYLTICLDNTKSEIRNTIRNVIVQNRRYRDLDRDTRAELEALLVEYKNQRNAVIRSNPLQHLI